MLLELSLLTLALLALLVATGVFDQLVRLQFERYPSQWVADGKPWGYFWRPRPAGKRPPFSVWSRRVLWARSLRALVWLLQTPPWIQQDLDLQGLLLYYRRFSVITLLLFTFAGLVAWSY